MTYRYAVKYETPQVFIFDGEVFLMLQFRAESVSDIQSEECPVDWWVIPRENDGGITIRYAFYRLIVQGFRRCQGMFATPVNLQGRSPHHRYFFSGAPIWKVDGKYYNELAGYSRAINLSYGAFYWKFGDSEFLGADGTRLWDTHSFWEEGTAVHGQNVQVVQEDNEDEDDDEDDEDEPYEDST
jgi:hypothetical protein